MRTLLSHVVLVLMAVTVVLAVDAARDGRYGTAVLLLVLAAGASPYVRRAREPRPPVTPDGYLERDAVVWTIQQRMDSELATRDDAECSMDTEWAKHNYAAAVLRELLGDFTGPQEASAETAATRG